MKCNGVFGTANKCEMLIKRQLDLCGFCGFDMRRVLASYAWDNYQTKLTLLILSIK